MAGVEKISITLTPDLAAVVGEAVASGGYASTSEVIREALRDWREKRVARERVIEEVRKLWNEGIESGVSHFQDVEEIIAERHRNKRAGAN